MSSSTHPLKFLLLPVLLRLALLRHNAQSFPIGHYRSATATATIARHQKTYRGRHVVDTAFFSVTSDTTTTAKTIENALHRAKDEHVAEVTSGYRTFGTIAAPSSDDDSSVAASSAATHGASWSDDDFVSRSVGVGVAGPDEAVLYRGDRVFQTRAPVFSKDECEAMIGEAREIITSELERERENLASATSAEEREPQQQQQQQQQPTNSQLGEARVSKMPRGSEWLKKAMRDKLFPLLESRFGGGEECSSAVRANELTLHDALVIGYGYFGAPTRSQPIHRDTSLISLNVALSPSTDYVGGGTYFEGLEVDGIIQNEQGHVLCHAGGAMHAGQSIESGERWVLVLFVIAKNAPQLARRCHARGVLARREGNLAEAANAFVAGLTMAPNDHILHRDLGGVYMAQGDREAAKAKLVKTSEAYHPCQKALIALGNMLLEEGKPDEALKNFNLALERMQDKDLSAGAWMPLRADGYSARMNAAHCALVCAHREAAAAATDTGDRSFALKWLPEAIRRIQICLEAAPGNGQLLSMRDTAIGLLEEAERISNHRS